MQKRQRLTEIPYSSGTGCRLSADRHRSCVPQTPQAHLGSIRPKYTISEAEVYIAEASTEVQLAKQYMADVQQNYLQRTSIAEVYLKYS